jgi:NSS family neurotransmitter:Na+ symporter
MVYLLFHVLRIDGAVEKLLLFLNPDFEQLTIQNIFAAMGQAFFSLTLGGTILVVYGSYLKKEESILKISIFSGLGDLGASILISLILVPTILVYGLNLQEGHTLLFSTLPVLFEQMPEGRILGTFFLFSLVLMAFLSSAAAVQFLSTSLNNNTKLTYKKSVILIGFLDLLLIIPCAFYGDIIPILDLIFGSGMQVIGSCCAIIALTWFIGRKITLKQIFNNEKNAFQNGYFIWLKWVIPAALILTLVLYIYSSIKNT